ncbi:DUF599 family protein [Aquicoccus sp. SCR17]|nr:DUF599 family protein [Carideicomes alvinocaridis]
MTWLDRIPGLTPLDLAALALLVLAWLGIGWRIESQRFRTRSMTLIMGEYRREWMRQMVTRNPRIFDAQALSNLRQATAFFASGTMIAIGGGLALVANPAPLVGVAQDLSLGGDTALVWEIKLIVMLVFGMNAFLKFVWSHRLFGYCMILAAAVPNDPEDSRAYPRAAQAAEINITAARSFNRGLRSTYFAMAASAWLLGAWPLIGAAAITSLVLWRREFASRSRRVLQEAHATEIPAPGNTQT